MAEDYDDISDGREPPNAAVKIVIALLVALAVFVVGWWLLQGPSARLTPATSARQGQNGGQPEAGPGTSGQQGATGANLSP